MVREARFAWDDEEGFDLRGQRGRLDEIEDPLLDTDPPDLPDEPKSSRRRRRKPPACRRSRHQEVGLDGGEHSEPAHADPRGKQSREESR